MVSEIVNKRIIENWESQDDPEHLRTIRDRILSSEQRAGYLLEFYQQIQQQGEVAANKNLESSELRLSGLVVQREGKLRVYNRVYQQVFNQNWVEVQLNNLRPYSENFRFWVASGGKDESRLLRGLALESAEEWAKDQNLSYQDKEFLAASRNKEEQEEMAAQKRKAELERERKDKEAAEKRTLVLSEANIQAKRRISIGGVVLFLALLGTVILAILAAREGNKAFQAQEMFKDANTKAEEADKKFQDANAKADVAEKKIMGLQQQAQQLQKNANVTKQQAQKATAQAKAEQQKAQKAQKTANDANQKAIEANQKFENANTKAEQERKKVIGLQQQAQQLQKNANVAKQQAQKETAQAKAEQQKAQKAQESAKLASQQAQIAKQEAEKLQNQLASAKKDVETVQALSKLAGKLRNENLTEDSDKALRQAGLSFRVEDHNLKQAMLLTSISQAYEKLKKPDEAEKKINESLEYLRIKGNKISSDEGLQIQVFVKANQGNFLAEKSPQQAIKAYQKVYNILKKYPTKTNPFGKDKILTANDIELVHRRLLKLLPNHNKSNFKKQVWSSLKEHFYAELGNLLNREKPNWEAADVKTTILMLFIANREEEREEEKYLDIPHIERFSCTDLKRVNKLWVDNSKRHFGFSVQKEIWVKTGNRLSIKPSESNYSDDQNFFDRFGVAVGWLQDYKDYRQGTWVSYSDMFRNINNNPFSQNWRGGLPTITRTGLSVAGTEWIVPYLRRLQAFFSRAATCDL